MSLNSIKMLFAVICISNISSNVTQIQASIQLEISGTMDLGSPQFSGESYLTNINSLDMPADANPASDTGEFNFPNTLVVFQAGTNTPITFNNMVINTFDSPTFDIFEIKLDDGTGLTSQFAWVDSTGAALNSDNLLDGLNAAVANSFSFTDLSLSNNGAEFARGTISNTEIISPSTSGDGNVPEPDGVIVWTTMIVLLYGCSSAVRNIR